MSELALFLTAIQPTQSPWANEDITNRVAALWVDHSALQISGVLAKEFGISITRSAIIAKITRMGLGGTSKTLRHPMQRAPRQKRSALRLVSSNATLFCDVPISMNLTLDDLKPDSCRYIARDDYLFCGHDKQDGSSYCPFHTKVTRKESQPTLGTRPFFREGFRR
jgi:hypothetical protein